MAASEAPFVWNHYRNIEGVDHVGAVTHYYDELAQSLYLNDGIATQVTKVTSGDWKNTIYEDEKSVTDDVFNVIQFDHPSNGVLYAVASDGATLTFLRYTYMMDLSRIINAWSILSTDDNPIIQTSIDVDNVGPEIFTDQASLFQPGAKVIYFIKFGDSSLYRIGTGRLDECNYDDLQETEEYHGRSSIGRYLKDQTFDDVTDYTGLSHEIATNILIYAGVKKYIVQVGTGNQPFTFKPTDNLLDGIGVMSEFYSYAEHDWNIIELPDETICIGYDYWLAQYQANGYYSFEVGKDIKKHKTAKNSDGSYAAIRATGRDIAGVDLTPVTVTIRNFPYWDIGAHRTCHLTAPDGLTQETLQIWAETKALEYQYVGIGETFECLTFQPQLLAGDIAETIEGDTGTSLGIITEVKHSFSKTDGFKTEFTIDSGGVSTEGDNYIVYSRAARMNGLNRKQNIMDIIRFVAGK